MNINDDYSLSTRVGPDADDESDIEFRSNREKYTVACDVSDWIAPLFVAAPDMLKACKKALEHLRNPMSDWASRECRIEELRAAIAKAEKVIA